MNGTIKLVAPLVAALAIAACSTSGSSNMPNAGTSSMNGPTGQASALRVTPEWQAKGLAHAACPQIVGQPTCLALAVNGVGHNTTPSGWTPTDLETAYNLPITKGSGQIVAIVDAGDHPDAATDLAKYRTQFGLGTANFFKYNQLGQQKNYPTYTGWHLEIDLDIDMVSAACPLCTIYLVEANSSSTSDLDTAENEAVALGAHIISNSWICYGSVNCVDPTAFSKPGVLYLAASGDAGYNQNGAPEALATVVSVGGTQLAKNGNKYSESAWNSAGSGCANGITKPSWQHDKGCTSRTDSDVSSESGCAPGVAEYDTLSGGWVVVCGTSAASPLIGAVYALAGNASTQTAAKALWTRKDKKTDKFLHDITTGSNGSCGGSYLCTAVPEYDGPTGWGTPNGIKAF